MPFPILYYMPIFAFSFRIISRVELTELIPCRRETKDKPNKINFRYIKFHIS